MYYDETRFQNDHHHQQPHRFVRGEVATTLWPQQEQNYWFPNWQELFHGFLVVQEGQPRQTILAGSEQSQGVVCPQHQHPTSPSLPRSGTQCLHLGTNNATQSPHCTVPLSQQPPQSSPVPCSGMRSGINNATQLPHPSSSVSHAVVQSLALPLHEELDRVQSGHAQVACPPSTQAPGPISKYTIKSPFWLPQGWVTEIHMRRTGTTAGTRDKYYKHLVSGRRFRSKNEVLHYISTGKGRTRIRDRHKKALPLSASHSFTANYAHKTHNILEASMPSSRGCLQSCSENEHPTHVGMLLRPGQWTELRPNGDSGPPSKQSISLSSCSNLRWPGSMLLMSKDIVQERPKKLPLKRKAKTLPPKMGDHRQASKLWQWLKQPVARENGEPLNQAVHSLNFSVPGVEKNASAMVDQRGVDDLPLRDQTAQRTIQLGREIQAAHKIVVQMSREMQATAEKFSREIQEAQKDAERGSVMKPPTVPAKLDVASIDKTKAGKRCRVNEAASRPYVMKSSVVQASNGHDFATKNLPQAADWPYFTLGSATHAVRRPDNPMGILTQGEPRVHTSTQATNSAMSAATQRRSPTQLTQMPVVDMRSVTQLALWPDTVLHHGTQSAQLASATMDDVTQAAKRHVDAASDATQSAQMVFARATNGIHVVETIRVQQLTKENVTVGDVTQPALWPEISAVHTRQPTQIAYIAMGSDAQAAERCGMVAGHTTQPTQMVYMGDGTQATQKHVVGASHSTRTAEVDCVAMSNVAQAAQRQIIPMGNLLPAPTQRPTSIGQTIASRENPPVANEMDNAVQRAAGRAQANPIYAAQLSASCGGSQPGQKLNLMRQKEEMKERYLRRKKFSAVLNPKLDLSRLNPALTTRQRAKVVQRMKTRHARDMLATLGRHLCRRAIQKKAMARQHIDTM